MVIGEITVKTCYGEAVIPVGILGKGPRPGTAWVCALNGLTPFTGVSHGGPTQDNTALWCTPMLRNVCIESDEDEPVEVDLQPGDRLEPAPDWFLEMAYEDRTHTD